MQVEKATIWLQLDPHTGKWDIHEQYPDTLARICVPITYNVTCINGKAVPAV